ncbi:hypothetical protein ACN28G_18020 [Micromonospora sp. WMMA1923]|uniref:hypothetical protein n=1 Tax=Micromonospora sp. WMMA1923 TaxID=3404125 RepID=UPI003B93AEDC
MRRSTRGGMMLAATIVGMAAGRALVAAGRQHRQHATGRRHRRRTTGRRSADASGQWQVVTVDRPPAQVLPGGVWPAPLRQLDGAVEVRVGSAPGERGTELAARWRPGVPAGLAAHLVGDDPARLVRQALRQVKQLAETGELLRSDRSSMDRPDGAGPGVW